MKYLDFFRAMMISIEFAVFLFGCALGYYHIGEPLISKISFSGVTFWAIAGLEVAGIGWFLSIYARPFLFGYSPEEKTLLSDFPQKYMLYSRLLSGILWLIICLITTCIGALMILNGLTYYGVVAISTALAIYAIDGLQMVFASFVLSEILSKEIKKT